MWLAIGFVVLTVVIYSSLQGSSNGRVKVSGKSGSQVDMRAFESDNLVHNITSNCVYEAIQVAINNANNGDEIEVAPGTYRETINFNGKAIRLMSSNGPEVTTIDGTGYYHVIQCVRGEGPSTVLDGFTITGGNAITIGYLSDRGAGMLNIGSSPTVNNCIFSDNTARLGSGMYNEDSRAIVTNCIFSRNVATKLGGAICNVVDSSPTVTNCTFSKNKAKDNCDIFSDIRSYANVNNRILWDNKPEFASGIFQYKHFIYSRE
jgi:hypothetical protein